MNYTMDRVEIAVKHDGDRSKCVEHVWYCKPSSSKFCWEQHGLAPPVSSMETCAYDAICCPSKATLLAVIGRQEQWGLYSH